MGCIKKFSCLLQLTLGEASGEARDIDFPLKPGWLRARPRIVGAHTRVRIFDNIQIIRRASRDISTGLSRRIATKYPRLATRIRVLCIRISETNGCTLSSLLLLILLTFFEQPSPFSPGKDALTKGR